MTDPQQQPAEVIRNFTAARKFPQLIGKTPDGKRIAGGPYTLTQGIVLAIVLIGALLFAFIVLQKGLLRIAEGGARG